MKFPSYLLLTIFIFTFVGINGQSPDYTYEFNKNGELVKGTPSLLRSGNSIGIKIDFDLASFSFKVDSIRGALTQDLVYWEQIKNKLEAKTPRPTYIGKVEKLVTELRSLFTFFQNKTANEMLMSSDIVCNPNLKAPVKEERLYTPAPEFIINGLVRQFRVKMDCNDLHCIAKVPLCLVIDCCGNYYFFGTCKTGLQKLEIAVYKTDVIKDVAINWYNDHLAAPFDYEKIEFLENAIHTDAVYPKIAKYLGTGTTHKPNCEALDTLKDLKKDWDLSAPVQYFSTNPDLITNAYTYMLQNVWLSPHGYLSINPFGFTNSSLYHEKPVAPEKKDTLDQHIINKTDTLLLENIRLDFKNYKDFYSLLYKRDSVKNHSDSITALTAKNSKASLSKADSANIAAFQSYQYTEVFRNKVLSPVSLIKDSLEHIRNYFFNTPPDKKDFWYEYPDNEKVILAVHNVPAIRNLSVANKLTTYTEQPVITTDGLAVTAAVAQAAPNGVQTALNNAIILNPTAFVEDLEYVKTPSLTVISRNEDTCKKNFLDISKTLRDDYIKFKFLDSIYISSQLPPFHLQKNYTDSPQLRTVLSYPDDGNKAPFEFDYKLSITDTAKNSTGVLIDSSYYKIGKKRFVEIALGFANALTHTEIVNVDTSNGTFNISNSETKLRFILGLKFHLRKIYWGNNHFVLTEGCDSKEQILQRISIFAGVSIVDPLSNFYTGAGIDLFPGLNFNTGVQWYRYTKYRINNNKIVDETKTYKPAVYLAVTTDPVLLISIIKTFFK